MSKNKVSSSNSQDLSKIQDNVTIGSGNIFSKGALSQDAMQNS
jgi:hypothetical protein